MTDSEEAALLADLNPAAERRGHEAFTGPEFFDARGLYGSRMTWCAGHGPTTARWRARQLRSCSAHPRCTRRPSQSTGGLAALVSACPSPPWAHELTDMVASLARQLQETATSPCGFPSPQHQDVQYEANVLSRSAPTIVDDVRDRRPMLNNLPALVVPYVLDDEDIVRFEVERNESFHPAGANKVVGSLCDAIEPAVEGANAVLDKVKENIQMKLRSNSPSRSQDYELGRSEGRGREFRG